MNAEGFTWVVGFGDFAYKSSAPRCTGLRQFSSRQNLCIFAYLLDSNSERCCCCKTLRGTSPNQRQPCQQTGLSSWPLTQKLGHLTHIWPAVWPDLTTWKHRAIPQLLHKPYLLGRDLQCSRQTWFGPHRPCVGMQATWVAKKQRFTRMFSSRRHKHQPNVGKYTTPMDAMGKDWFDPWMNSINLRAPGFWFCAAMPTGMDCCNLVSQFL